MPTTELYTALRGNTVQRVTEYYYYKDSSYPRIVPGINSSNLAVQTSGTRISSITPDFHRRRNLGNLPVNSYSVRTETIHYTAIEGVFYRQESGFPNWRVIATSGPADAYTEKLSYSGNYLDFSMADFTSLDNRVTTELRLRVKDQKVNLAQLYAERAQTARTVAETATSIAEALGALKKGNLAKAAAALGLKLPKADPINGKSDKALSSAWLRLQYGWKPLIGDLHGTLEAYAIKNHGYPKTKSSAKGEATVSDRVVTTGGIDDNRWTMIVERSSTRQLRKSVTYSGVDSPLNDRVSLGLTNPATIAWELMPWSFVIDWFLPIGDFINSWDATVGLNFSHGHTGVRDKQTITIRKTYEMRKPLGAYQNTGSLGTLVFSKTVDAYQRTPLVDFPSVRPPVFKNPVSVEHALNALALLQSKRR